MTSVNWQNYKIENYQTHTFASTINDKAFEETYPEERAKEHRALKPESTTTDDNLDRQEVPEAPVEHIEVRVETRTYNDAAYENSKRDIMHIAPEELINEQMDEEIEVRVETRTYNDTAYESVKRDIMHIAPAEFAPAELAEQIELRVDIKADTNITNESVAQAVTQAAPVDRSKMQFKEPEIVPMPDAPRRVSAIY